MQEDIEMRSVTLTINGTKFSGRMLKNAITKLLAHMKEGRQQHKAQGEVIHHGKQSVKQLIGQNQGVQNIEINDRGIKQFERIARKYGVDYAVKQVKGDKPKFLVFFKARDGDALMAALTEYSQQRIRKADCPSVIKLLHTMKQRVANRERSPEKNRNREQSR